MRHLGATVKRQLGSVWYAEMKTVFSARPNKVWPWHPRSIGNININDFHELKAVIGERPLDTNRKEQRHCGRRPIVEILR